MSQNLAEPKFHKNKIYQYKCVSDPYRVKQLGGVEASMWWHRGVSNQVKYADRTQVNKVRNRCTMWDQQSEEPSPSWTSYHGVTQLRCYMSLRPPRHPSQLTLSGTALSSESHRALCVAGRQSRGRALRVGGFRASTTSRWCANATWFHVGCWGLCLEIG